MLPDHAAARGGRNQRVVRAGEYFVLAELHKRGAYGAAFIGNMPRFDIISIQVKTKSIGSWQTKALMEQSAQPLEPQVETGFWVLVDLGAPEGAPRYWVVPDTWILNDIYDTHRTYLSQQGGRRARNPVSPHHAIAEIRVQNWKSTGGKSWVSSDPSASD
jgi:hypothetical protein